MTENKKYTNLVGTYDQTNSTKYNLTYYTGHPTLNQILNLRLMNSDGEVIDYLNLATLDFKLKG